MRKAKELIGKAIIHQTTGEKFATVHDVVIDAQTATVCGLLINSGGWFDEAHVVPWSRVRAVGDVILVHGDPPLIRTAEEAGVTEQLKPDARVSGTAIVSDSGERLGTVGDLFIDDTGHVVGYEVKQGFTPLAGRKFLPAAQVHAVGHDAVIATTSQLEPAKDHRQGS